MEDPKDIVHKILVIITVFLLSALFGLAPKLFFRRLVDSRGSVLCYNFFTDHIPKLLRFGGGFLLSICFLHILPEILEDYYKPIKVKKTYPICELALICGFVLMYVIGQIFTCCGGEVENHMFGQYKSDDSVAELETQGSFRRLSSDAESNPAKVATETVSYGSVITAESDHAFRNNVDTGGNKASASQTAFLVAISIHSILEGIAVGLQSKVEDMLLLSGAIMAHKAVLIMCMGLSLVTAGVKSLQVIIYVLIFASGTPIGMTAGLLVQVFQTGVTESDINATLKSVPLLIIQSVGTGTLLNVAVFELLKEDEKTYSKNRTTCSRVMECLGLVLGVCVGAVLQLVAEE